MTSIYAAAKSLQSCPTLCDPIDGSPLGSSVPGILQARILEWVAISFSKGCMYAKSLQSCLTLCNPMDSSPPGSSVHGILQARILEWVAISFSNWGHYLCSDKDLHNGNKIPLLKRWIETAFPSIIFCKLFPLILRTTQSRTPQSYCKLLILVLVLGVI